MSMERYVGSARAALSSLALRRVTGITTFLRLNLLQSGVTRWRLMEIS